VVGGETFIELGLFVGGHRVTFARLFLSWPAPSFCELNGLGQGAERTVP
jgi:hypothetical protein